MKGIRNFRISLTVAGFKIDISNNSSYTICLENDNREMIGLLSKTRFYCRVLFGVILVLSSTLHIKAQITNSTESSFELTSKKNRSVTIPFKLYNNLIVIPLSINGSDTLNMILDTGVRNTLITSLQTNEEVNLNYSRTVRIRGLGEGASIEALASYGNTIKIDRALGKNQEILVLVEDIFFLSALLGTNVHGLIGHSAFKDFIVEIDYEKKRIKFHDHERFQKGYSKRKNSSKWTALPLTFRDDKPYLDLEITEKDGSKSTVNLLIDSGASHTMALYYSANDELDLPKPRIRSFLGSGLSGEIHGYLGKLQELRIGDYVLNEPISSYPDEEGIKRALVYSSRDGSIGADILRRFKIFFNYQDSTLLLQPNEFFKDKFTYNMSGLDIGAPYPNIPLYEITQVREGSIADLSGLQKGDIISELNGKRAIKYSINEVISIFQGKSGRKINIRVMRDNKYMRKEFTLRDELN